MFNHSKPDIILNGATCNYRFNPWRKGSLFQKSSKFSHVFKGEDETGKPLVIKVLPSQLADKPYQIERFKAELRWHNFHDNILAPFEYLYQCDKHFLIANYYKSINLEYYRKRILMFTPNRIRLALECGIQLLNALEHVHAQGYIHSDIKPGNVLLTGNVGWWQSLLGAQFKLIDFGSAHRAFDNPGLHGMEQWPYVLVYSAPEQVFGFWELTGYQADLYAVAILMYEMITKEPLYDSNLSVKVMNLQTSYPLQPHNAIPEPLMAILRKAAHKHHFKKPPNHYKRSEIVDFTREALAQRYQTASKFKAALLEYYNEITPTFAAK